jgi:CHAD domain-containing protein
MAAAIAHPVRTLRHLVATLEATIALTLDHPKPKPVHRLRTVTRRIEAQFELLSLLPHLPAHAKQAKKARRFLRKLRRAAGAVRDLDIQCDLIRSRSHEANHLRSLLRQQREEASEQLVDTIHRHQPKLARHLESLLKALTPAESFTLSATHLAQLVLHWYAHNIPATAKQNHRHLHGIRKTAKLARYIIESANPGARSSPYRLARAFESLQQSGGEWHDWLTMSDIAHRELGSSSSLVQAFARRCEKSLTKYQRHLKSLSKNLSTTPISKI